MKNTTGKFRKIALSLCSLLALSPFSSHNTDASYLIPSYKCNYHWWAKGYLQALRNCHHRYYSLPRPQLNYYYDQGRPNYYYDQGRLNYYY